MWGWLRRPHAEPDHRPELTVVTGVGCHLCEEMLAVVADEVEPQAGATAQPAVLDVDAAYAAGQITREQHERWSTLVPVLLVDGREAAHYRVAPGQVAALLGRHPGGRDGGRFRRFGGSGGATIE